MLTFNIPYLFNAPQRLKNKTKPQTKKQKQQQKNETPQNTNQIKQVKTLKLCLNPCDTFSANIGLDSL